MQALTIVTHVTNSDHHLADSDLIENYGGEITLEDFEGAVYEDLEDVAPVSETRTTNVPFLSLLNVSNEDAETDQDIDMCVAGITAHRKAAALGDNVDPREISAVKLLLDLGNRAFDVLASLQEWGFSRSNAIGLMYLAKPEVFAATESL